MEFNASKTLIVSKDFSIKNQSKARGFVVPISVAQMYYYLNANKIDSIICYEDYTENEYVAKYLQSAQDKGMDIFYRDVNAKSIIQIPDNYNFLGRTCVASVFDKDVRHKPTTDTVKSAQFRETRQQQREDLLAELNKCYSEMYIDIPSITEQEKILYSKELRYFDLEIPHTEIEWKIAVIQLKFYKQNNIENSIDKNTHYICPECGAIVPRYYEEQHMCYSEEVPKRTKMDFIVNADA